MAVIIVEQGSKDYFCPVVIDVSGTQRIVLVCVEADACTFQELLKRRYLLVLGPSVSDVRSPKVFDLGLE